MKLVYGFRIPIEIYEDMKIRKSLNNIFQYPLENHQEVLVGEMFRTDDNQYLILNETITKQMEEFVDKDRIAELTFMKNMEKILKSWWVSFQKISEEFKKTWPEATEEEFDKNVTPFSLPESLEFNWYVI
jgi:hypothetical protein